MLPVVMGSAVRGAIRSTRSFAIYLVVFADWIWRQAIIAHPFGFVVFRDWGLFRHAL